MISSADMELRGFELIHEVGDALKDDDDAEVGGDDNRDNWYTQQLKTGRNRLNEDTKRLFECFRILPCPVPVELFAQSLKLDTHKKNPTPEEKKKVQRLWTEFLGDFRDRDTQRAREMLEPVARALRTYAKDAPQWTRTLLGALEKPPAAPAQSEEPPPQLEPEQPFKIGILYKDQAGQELVRKIMKTAEADLELLENKLGLTDIDKDKKPERQRLKQLVDCCAGYLNVTSDFIMVWKLEGGGIVADDHTHNIKDFKFTLNAKWTDEPEKRPAKRIKLSQSQAEPERKERKQLSVVQVGAPDEKKHHQYLFCHRALRCGRNKVHDPFYSFLIGLGHEIGHVVTKLHFPYAFTNDAKNKDWLRQDGEEARNVGKALLDHRAKSVQSLVTEAKKDPQGAGRCFLVTDTFSLRSALSIPGANNGIKDMKEWLYLPVANVLRGGSEDIVYRLAENVLRFELADGQGYLNFPDLQRVGYLTESDLYDADEKKDEENAESSEEDSSSESKQKESEQKDHDEPSYYKDQESDSEEREIPEENKEGADAENESKSESGDESEDGSEDGSDSAFGDVSSDVSDGVHTDVEEGSPEEGPDKEDLRRLLDLLPLREASNIIARMIQKKMKMSAKLRRRHLLRKANLTKVAKLRLKKKPQAP